jgi:PKD repeat protein
VVINELDCDQDGADTGEFVELFDGGAGNTPLDGITLVLFNGSSDTVYAAFPLAGFETDEDGYFLAGNAAIDPDLAWADGALQNGPDAVALYAGNINTGYPVTTVNLLDAVVYGTNDDDDTGLLALLSPGESMADEGDASTAPFVSLQRCPNGEGVPFTLMPFRRSAPTPRAPSTCPANLPLAAFTVTPETIYGGDPVSFVDASTGTLLAYHWDFEGGSPSTSSLQNPAGVIFAESGPQRVTLRISNGAGSDQAEAVIHVLDPAPFVDGITVQGTPAPCGSVIFGLDGLAGKPPLTVTWTVRDGQSALAHEATGSSTTWNLAASAVPGNYSVTADIENESSSRAIVSTTVGVMDNRPNVELSTGVPPVTNVDTVPLSIAIESQSVTSGIEVTDLQLENFTVESFSGNNDLYAVTLRFVEEGSASVAVAPGAAEILCGVPTRASNLLALTLDQRAPAITLSSPAPSASPNPLFRIELATTEPVTGLEEQDFLLEGCTLTDLYAQGEGYVAFVFATGPGVISIQLRARAVEDAAENTSEPSNILQRAYIPLQEGEQPYDHSADINQDGSITLDEVLRVVQFFNVGSLHCEGETEDGYAPGPGSKLCYPHKSDYLPELWTISLSELLRLIQLYSLGAYRDCNTKTSEDGYCVES